jgi:hypothetical protein
MRRLALACAIVVGLAIGSGVRTSAIGLTQVTLSCDDGTTTALVVDADTLTGLVQGVQAMIDYPAGLTCTLVQLPGVVGIGGIALASPGQSPFIVGGGRWDVACEVVFPPPCDSCCDPVLGCGSIPPPVVARPGGRAPGSWLSPVSAAQPSDQTVSVNIAVNFHQRDDGSFFGTLNETIPANQSCGDTPVGETHFTSKPEASPLGCFGTVDGDPSTAHVVSRVTQTSGQHPFPDGSNGFLSTTPPNDIIHFSFTDNGNPGHQPDGVDDMLQGPPAGNKSQCVRDADTNFVTATGLPPAFRLKNGNITLHPKP